MNLLFKIQGGPKLCVKYVKAGRDKKTNKDKRKHKCINGPVQS